MTAQHSACAIAHTNIALIKSWGKLNVPGNYPAVPSLSLTLDRLFTRTEVTFDARQANDELELDGHLVDGRPLERVTCLLDAVRSLASFNYRASVRTVNNFPTASGLASSASGFAALALAASRAAGVNSSLQHASALARASSASAARSLFGGWVALDVDASAAVKLSLEHNWDLALVIAVTKKGPKAVSSTDGMNICSRTSPIYKTWLDQARILFERARQALNRGDFEALGQTMEDSTLLMHATMMTASPALIYLAPVSLQIIRLVQLRRAAGEPVYFTTDAGPHVKVLTVRDNAARVKNWLREVRGVCDVLDLQTRPRRFHSGAHIGKSTV